MNEVERCLDEINNAIARFKFRGVNDPKYLVLPLAHRQAIKMIKQNWLGLEPKFYGNIEIINKEDVIIVGGEGHSE